MSKSFSLEDSDTLRELINSLIDSGWKGNWDAKDGKITIDGSSGPTLEEYVKENTALDFHETVRLAVCLGVQLAALTGMSKGVLFFSLSDVQVINSEWYLLTNLDKVLPMNENRQLTLRRPIKFDGFLPPELKGVNRLPLVTDQSCAFYSLALLCIAAIKIDPSLHQIADTSLYFLLKRCLVDDPEARIFLLI